MSPALAPPWCIFADEGKSVAVIRAGRPGEVADVRFVPDDVVARLVSHANHWPAFAGLVAEELRALNEVHRMAKEIARVPSMFDDPAVRELLSEHVMPGLFAEKENPHMSDPVNHPKHYSVHPSGIEAIEICEHFSFTVGNAIKYLWRAGQKGNALEDIKKALWYLERAVKAGDGYAISESLAWKIAMVVAAEPDSALGRALMRLVGAAAEEVRRPRKTALALEVLAQELKKTIESAAT
jgi:hypothetical protein